MYSADPVQPRPNLIRDAVPTPRPTPYLWTGLGWTNFWGSVFVDEHLHTLCVWTIRPTMPPPRALWPPVPEGADLACRAERAGGPATDACAVKWAKAANSQRPEGPW
jgi:hypothetical protein